MLFFLSADWVFYSSYSNDLIEISLINLKDTHMVDYFKIQSNGVLFIIFFTLS